ncbi:MAG: tetratricopeptide repeat protein [Chloroflexota bacterium]
MRRIALHEYLSQIEGLVDDNRLPEAAAHCHFVLQQYPRHIGAYRLFGRALLEQQLYEDAIDVFERLLSADPEDLISHAGLALAYSESRDLERAIWHMERAFEVDPYNRAIQDELRKLYIARDGDAPPRLALTRAALARLHLRAALYEQASTEFAQLVAANPERIDLKLALGETLYRIASLAEAAGLCQEVLETLPYCIKANAIVADALLSDERIDEARQYLRRVQDLTMLDRARLDPDTILGQVLGNSRISLPESVQVEVLEDTLAFAREFEESGAWPEAATAVVVDGETLPDWLQALGNPEGPPQPERSTKPEEKPEPVEMIDWLDEVTTSDSDGFANSGIESTFAPGQALEEAVTGTEEKPDSDPDEFMVATDDTLADVLKDMRSVDEIDRSADTAQTGSAKDSLDETSLDLSAEAADSEAPIWEEGQLLALDELRSYIDGDSEPSTLGGSSPEWLDELTEGSDVSGELPGWLHEAIGFEAPASSAADLLNPQAREDASSAGRQEQGSDSLIQEEPAKSDVADPDKLGDRFEGEVSYTEESSEDVATGPTVPDWLLEGEEVLEELPDELLPDAKSVARVKAADETMTWLDELTKQLAEMDDSGIGQGASSPVVEEDEADEPPADAIAT